MSDSGISQRALAASAALDAANEKAKSDLERFFIDVWANEPGFQLADFHREAIDAFEDPSKKFVYWEAPRGHGKTSLATAFIVKAIGNNPNHRIKIIGSNDKEARKRLFEIKTHIQKNATLRHLFPKLRRPTEGGEWNKSRITLEREIASKDPTVEAMGIMSSALGSRATIIYLDDIVDLRNSILQPQMKEHVKQKLFGEIIPLLEPDGVIRATGTAWTKTDVNAIMRESPGWQVVGPHRVGTDQDPLSPIWPFMFTRQLLEQLEKTLGKAEFSRAYRNMPLTRDTVPIQGQWIRYYDANILGDPNQYFCVQSVDLAIGENAENDYFAHATLLWDTTRDYVFVVDAWCDRISFRTQSTAVVRSWEKWVAQMVAIERGGYQGSLESYLREDSKTMINIFPFQNRGRSKARRYVEASPFFEKGMVWFHPKFDPSQNLEMDRNLNPVEQLTSFPLARHDDISDAIIQGLLTILEMKPQLANQEEDHDDDTDNFEDGDGMSIRTAVY